MIVASTNMTATYVAVMGVSSRQGTGLFCIRASRISHQSESPCPLNPPSAP
jgi:hypothetical protein